MKTLTENISRIKKLSGIKKTKTYINEAAGVTGKTLVSVDIQPEYQSGFFFNREFGKFINKSAKNNRIVFLFNGPDLGMISESDYQQWLVEECSISEEIIYEYAEFYDKSYAFFRYCMDKGVDEDALVDMVKFMYGHNINDSREMTEETWHLFMEEYDRSDIRELLEFSDDCIHIPDLMGFLSNRNNLVLFGGGVDECLKEVEIACRALNKPYDLYHPFCY